MASHPLMGHLVLGYPDLTTSHATAAAYAEAGLRFLELQIPFSHPTADGPLITDANRVAVANGTTLEDCLAVISDLAHRYPATERIAMTYANPVVHHGAAACVAALAEVGVTGLIVPDLALESPVAEGLWGHPTLRPIPVVGPNTTPERLARLLALGPRYVYCMSGYKLTGTGFSLDARLEGLVAQCHGAGAEVGIGFGIDSRAAVEAVLAIADFAIVGSALLRAQASGQLHQILAELTGSGHPA